MKREKSEKKILKEKYLDLYIKRVWPISEWKECICCNMVFILEKGWKTGSICPDPVYICKKCAPSRKTAHYLVNDIRNYRTEDFTLSGKQNSIYDYPLRLRLTHILKT